MLPFSEACERNKQPILEILKTSFARCTQVLEIGSGTGQHAVHFSQHLPHLIWHPTEQLPYLPGLAQRVQLEGGPTLRPPSVLDVQQRVWPLRCVDGAFTANTLHIMSWPEVIALFRGLSTCLAAGGALCIYGPFRCAGRVTSASNHDFDVMLQARDPNSGLRDTERVVNLAATHGIRLQSDHDLPAFNRLLVFYKEPV